MKWTDINDSIDINVECGIYRKNYTAHFALPPNRFKPAAKSLTDFFSSAAPEK